MAYASEMLRGNTETIILAILIKHDSYGYEILKTINDNGGGIVDIKDATIYTSFRRMEKEELITTYWGDETGVARRRYYSITEKGRQYYKDRLQDWKGTIEILSNLIEGRSNQ